MDIQETSQRILSGILVPSGFPGLPVGWFASQEQLLSTDGKRKLSIWVFSKAKAFGTRDSKNGHRALAIIHGMGEHGGRYQHFPNFVQAVVDTVVCLDHLGHGKSEGLRGHIDTFDRFVDDSVAFLDLVHKKLEEIHGRSEVHLFAHSLGGHIGLRLLLKGYRALASAAISAPFLALKAPVDPIKKLAAKLLAKAAPWVQLDTALDVKTISRDPAVIENYQTDRLVHSKMTPGFFATMTQAQDDTLLRSETIQVPVQFFIPLADGLVDSEASIKFFDRVRAGEKALKTYTGVFHETFNDLGKEKAFTDLTYWIQEHSR